MGRIKVAIACQGGGSQTAFTAGAMKGLLEAGARQEFEVVSVSGTSTRRSRNLSGRAACVPTTFPKKSGSSRSIPPRTSAFHWSQTISLTAGTRSRATSRCSISSTIWK